MEEDADDLDNLFDEYDSNDPQPQENNNENAENDAAVPEKVPVPKRVVKPRVKFNPERLCGKRGIPILVDHFKDVKFKGKGHEKEDLKKLLTTLELWTHRLFPSMKFEDCLRQIEHLGKKRPVKTCVQKIRLDFPILDKDFVRNEDEEEEEQEQPNELEPEPPALDAFDRLFDGYRERAEPVLTSTPSSSQTVGNVLGTSFGASISEEQKKRMEYNKMLAIERRKAKLSAMQSNSLNTESSTNVETVLNSSSTARRDTDDPNFLFDYLQKQFTDTSSSNADKETKKYLQSNNEHVSERMNEMMESVDENDRNETDYNMSSITNKDCTKDNGKEELGLDELMDLVDEDSKDGADHNASCDKDNDESDHDAMSNNCPDDNGKEELGLDELVDKNNKDGTVLDASCSKDNDESALSNNCPNGNGKEELELDELMDLVDESNSNETSHDALSDAKNTDENDHDVISNVKTIDCPENNSKKDLELDELMDLVEEDHQDTTDDVVLPRKNAVLDLDNYEQLNSTESETNVRECIEKTKEIDTELQNELSEKKN